MTALDASRCDGGPGARFQRTGAHAGESVDHVEWRQRGKTLSLAIYRPAVGSEGHGCDGRAATSAGWGSRSRCRSISRPRLRGRRHQRAAVPSALHHRARPHDSGRYPARLRRLVRRICADGVCSNLARLFRVCQKVRRWPCLRRPRPKSLVDCRRDHDGPAGDRRDRLALVRLHDLDYEAGRRRAVDQSARFSRRCLAASAGDDSIDARRVCVERRLPRSRERRARPYQQVLIDASNHRFTDKMHELKRGIRRRARLDFSVAFCEMT